MQPTSAYAFSISRQSARLYSSETEAKEAEKSKEAVKDGEEPMKKELEVKTKEAKEMKV